MESNIEKILGIVSRQIVPYTVPTLIEKCDFFNRLNEIGSGNLATLAKEFNFDERVFETVLNYLAKENFLNKVFQDDEYIFELSNSAKEFLLKGSKYDFTNYAVLFNGSVPDKMGESIMTALRTGKPAKWDNEANWEQQMKSGAISKAFSQGMMSRGIYLRDFLSNALSDVLGNTRNLIDVGGSLGDYCGKFTNDYKTLKCTVFDVPAVIERAKINIADKKYERVSLLSGDMFKDVFPNNFDAFLYSNAIHDWDCEQVPFLFSKTFQALENNGVIIIHDCHLDSNKTSPNYAVDHSLYLSIFTDGRYYSYDEISNMLKDAGFKKIETIKTVAGFSAILGYKI